MRGIELPFITDYVGPGVVEARVNDVVEFSYGEALAMGVGGLPNNCYNASKKCFATSWIL